MDNPQSEKLVALIESLAAGTLVPEESSQLEEILSGDLAARRSYLQRMFLIADLKCRFNPRVHRLRGAPSIALTSPDGPAVDSSTERAPVRTDIDGGRNTESPPIPLFDLSEYIEPTTPFVLSSKYRPGMKMSPRGDGPIATLLAAAGALWQAVARRRAIAMAVGAVVLVVTATMYFNQPGPVVVARIEKAIGPVWNAVDGISPREGDALKTGQVLDLAEGEITLKFVDGATTLVHGPAKIRFVAANAARLDQGELLANVPPAAVGFTVETPSVRIVDLGTQFTLAVDSRQTTEVQVTQGKVEAAHRGSDGAFSAPQVVSAGQAVRANPGGALKSIAFDPASANRFEALKLTVIAHYRLGEDDKPEEPGVSRPAVGSMVLRKAGKIVYAADASSSPRNQAVSFSGNADDILTADAALPTDLDNWVLEAWVRPHSLKDGPIVQNGVPGSEAFGLSLRGGRWACNFRNRGTSVPQPLPEVGQWMHVALVRQHGKHWFWVDSMALLEISDPPALKPAGVFAIGGYPARPEETFDGDIAAVRFSRLDGPFDPAMFLDRNDSHE